LADFQIVILPVCLYRQDETRILAVVGGFCNSLLFNCLPRTPAGIITLLRRKSLISVRDDGCALLEMAILISLEPFKKACRQPRTG